jgi:HSP20 family protein
LARLTKLNSALGDEEVVNMLMRTDPFRELDRLTEQVFGTATRPAVMPMDAWRHGDEFVVEFDLPGVSPGEVDLDIERNVLTVKAERPRGDGQDTEMVVAERPCGVFTRQLFLGDNLDTDRVRAEYDAGVLRLTIPISEQAKPRKIDIAGNGQRHAIKS